jgi:hypothetical protein
MSNEVERKANTIWEAVVFILLTKVFLKYTVQMVSGGMICIRSLMTTGFEYSKNIKAVTSTIWEAEMVVLLMRRICKIRRLDGPR